MQDLYIENYKMLQKVIKESLNKCRSIPCLCIKNLNIAMMFVLLKLASRFNTISIKIPAGIFLQTHKMI